jgi:hypothetical protein
VSKEYYISITSRGQLQSKTEERPAVSILSTYLHILQSGPEVKYTSSFLDRPKTPLKTREDAVVSEVINTRRPLFLDKKDCGDVH